MAVFLSPLHSLPPKCCSLMTSCKFKDFLTPPPLSHSMLVLLRALYTVSQKCKPTSPQLRDVIYECSSRASKIICLRIFVPIFSSQFFSDQPNLSPLVYDSTAVEWSNGRMRSNLVFYYCNRFFYFLFFSVSDF